MRRALVIGGTGFVGLNLVDALVARGVETRVTRRRRSITAFVRSRPVELVEADLGDVDSLVRAMRGVDVVFLAAGHYPRYSLDRDAALRTGVQQVRHACEAALRAGVERLVFTSSTGALAQAPAGRPADERDVPAEMPADSVYRAVKWALEREVEAAVARGLPAVTVIPAGCVGPWDVRCGTGGILVGTVRGLLPWYVDGTVNLVDVGDVATAHVRAACAEPGSRYCVAGHTVSMHSLLELLVRRYGGRMPPERLSADAGRARADAEERAAAPTRARVPMPRELVDLVAAGQPVSSERARRELGIRFASLEEALDRAHEWFRRYRYLPARAETEDGWSRAPDAIA